MMMARMMMSLVIAFNFHEWIVEWIVVLLLCVRMSVYVCM